MKEFIVMCMKNYKKAWKRTQQTSRECKSKGSDQPETAPDSPVDHLIVHTQYAVYSLVYDYYLEQIVK